MSTNHQIIPNRNLNHIQQPLPDYVKDELMANQGLIECGNENQITSCRVSLGYATIIAG